MEGLLTTASDGGAVGGDSVLVAVVTVTEGWVSKLLCRTTCEVIVGFGEFGNLGF